MAYPLAIGPFLTGFRAAPISASNEFLEMLADI
jgi:hypothetical protein